MEAPFSPIESDGANLCRTMLTKTKLKPAFYGKLHASDCAVCCGVDFIIYIMLLSDLENLLSVWENVLSIANVT